jgi:beta-phosphoglucomutase-like phosphatase (HAD superfamily)
MATRPHRWSSLLLALALLGAPRVVRADEDDPDVEIARRHLDKGWTFYDGHEWAKALQEFQAAQLVRPQLGLWQNIGSCLDKLGRLPEALEAYERALADSPATVSETLRKRVDELRGMKARGQLAVVPGAVENKRFDKGRKLYESHDYEHALTEFEAARKSRPPPLTVDYQIARTLDHLERYKEAIAAYERFLATGPDPFTSEEALKRLRILKERVAVIEGTPPGGLPPATPVEKAKSEERPNRFEGAARAGEVEPGDPLLPRRSERRNERIERPAVRPVPPPVSRPRSVPPPVAEPPRSFGRDHAIPIVVGAGAIALLATGIALAASVAPGFNDLKATCAPACDPADWQGLQRRANAGYALIAIAGVAAAVDIGLWIWELKFRRPSVARAWLAPETGGGLAGRF